MPIILLENIGVCFGDNIALKDISFAVEKGEYIGLIGPNGAGKSTLLQVILGEISPSSGEIFKEKNTNFGYVPQNYFLQTSFSVSVEEVLEIASKSFFWRSKKEKTRKKEVLEMVGMNEDFLGKNFQNLSGGQKQRVILARSLMRNPDVLLFDEPLSGVDFQTKIQIYELLASLNKTYKTTIIFVSHEIESIISKCHRILCLNKSLHEGCHPIEFSKGNNFCPMRHKNNSMHPIHHHHNT